MTILAQQGGRRGAALDLAIWLGIIALALVGASFGRRLGVPEQAWAMVAAPGQMLVLVIATTLLLRRRGETWASLGFSRPRSARQVAGLVALGYGGALVVNALGVLLIFPLFNLPRPSFGAFGELKGHPGLYAYWLVAAWLSAAIGEELQFRAFLWSRLERLFGGAPANGKTWTWIPALIGQAALFGLGHGYQGPAGLIVTAGLGLVLGGVYLAARRNLVACMVLHGLIDTVSLTALFLVGAKALATGTPT